MKRTSNVMDAAAIEDMTMPERHRYLSAIDQLRELGVNESVSLLQLVVAGDQSSGKSSLLEGLTGFSFPVASELCTRFATQIVMRQASASAAIVNISIIPGPSSRVDEQIKKKFNSFARSIKSNKFGSEEFASIILEASVIIGLPGTMDATLQESAKRLSEDLLKIEISGPEHHHLSVVDVPGLFHNPTKYQTEDDKLIIRQMINDYMHDSRTIILAVMDARDKLANQEVFELARKADPDGVRTVGVITKCDALQHGDEESVLRIAHNEVERLRHAWFAVRNRTTNDIKEGVTIQQRHEKEKTFFTTSPFNRLSKARCGIPALKAFLGQLLYEHIRREFPNVSREVERLHAEAQQSLNAMDPPRQTVIEQRQFLTRVATLYQRLVDDSLRGNYSSDLEARHALKMRMHLRSTADKFEARMRKRGHTKIFHVVEGGEDHEYSRKGEKDQSDIYTWIRDQYRDSRGAERPGTVNPALLEVLFRQQSRSWENIARSYLDEPEQIVRKYNIAAHDSLISELSVRDTLMNRLGMFTSSATATAHEELRKVLADEREVILQTVNHYYATTLQEIRRERVLCRLEAMGLTNGCHDVDMQALLKDAHLSNEEQAVNDIHDILKAYYMVAMKRFMDNVLIGVVERHLVGMGSPVRFFTPESVALLDNESLSSIAEESFTSTRTREDILRQFRRFEEALKVIKGLRQDRAGDWQGTW